jgi:hypothetical protein
MRESLPAKVSVAAFLQAQAAAAAAEIAAIESALEAARVAGGAGPRRKSIRAVAAAPLKA